MANAPDAPRTPAETTPAIAFDAALREAQSLPELFARALPALAALCGAHAAAAWFPEAAGDGPASSSWGEAFDPAGVPADDADAVRASVHRLAALDRAVLAPAEADAPASLRRAADRLRAGSVWLVPLGTDAGSRGIAALLRRDGFPPDATAVSALLSACGRRLGEWMTAQRLRREAAREAASVAAVAAVVDDFAMLTLSPDGRIESFGGAAERLFARDAKSTVGDELASLFRPEDRLAGRPASILRVAGDGERFLHEGVYLRGDGSRFLGRASFVVRPGSEGRPAGFTVGIRAIDDRRAFEASRDRADRAEHARDVVEAREERTATAAREVAATLREAVAGLDAAAARLESVGASEGAAAVRAQIARIAGCPARLAVDPGADALRVGAAPIDAAALVGAVRDDVGSVAAERRVRFDVAIDADVTKPVLDAASLRAIATGLALSAVRRARPDGRASLRLRAEGEDHLRVEARDDGYGIGVDAIRRLFEGPATPAGRAGAAPDLATVHRLATALGGRVSVSNTPGRGTVLAAILPRDATRAPDRAGRASEGRRANRAVVLSGDAGVRSRLLWTLGAHGIAGVLAATPDAAIDVARELPCEVAAVDAFLASGAVDFVTRLRSEAAAPVIPCVLVAVPVGDAVAGLVGADLLARPVVADRLFAALERAGVAPHPERPVHVVDRDERARRVAADVLTRLGHAVVATGDGEESLRRATSATPSAVLVAPAMDGLGVFRYLHGLRRAMDETAFPILLSLPRRVGDEDATLLRLAAEQVLETADDRAAWLLDGIEGSCPVGGAGACPAG